jgi:hypothetical protein
MVDEDGVRGHDDALRRGLAAHERNHAERQHEGLHRTTTVRTTVAE